jgi:hypothetical protein
VRHARQCRLKSDGFAAERNPMIPTHPESLQDRPITIRDRDALQRGPFVQSLIRALIKEQRDANDAFVACSATGYVLGEKFHHTT